MKALILDDELYCTEALEVLISRHVQPPIETYAFTDPFKALEFLKQHTVDLLFLDVEMPVMSGFDFLEKAENFKGTVIFTTAYDTYALKAFQVDAVAYLLKPVDKNELLRAIEKVSRIPAMADRQLMSLLREKLTSTTQAERKIAISTSEGIHLIAPEKVVRCESDGSYSTIFFQDAKPLLVSKNLRELEGLFDSRNFFRVHKSHLINLAHIQFVSRHDGGDVRMSDGSNIPISRSAKQEFFDRIRA
ncbi:MAG: response regulator transcription factor [Bacteroidetes bacterium]|nr:response regulator transcription factor [Bacteroidota bacterium]